MSGDEVCVMLASIAFGPVAWVLWLRRLRLVDGARRRAAAIRALGLALGACAAGLLAVLLTLAAHDVRDSPRYLLLYSVLGLAWVRLAMRVLPWLGLSPRDDLIERGNDAALPAVIGFLGALTLAFAGGNIGDGPGWWVVVACAVLASGTVLLAWLILQTLTAVAEVVTVERDPAAGWRLGAFLIAVGLIAGRAVAGDWVSAEATCTDFVLQAWPVLPLLAVAVLVELAARPKPDTHAAPFLKLGLGPALTYVVLAVIHVVSAGLPR